MNDCINVLKECKISLFADDCVLYYSGNNWNMVHDVLQGELGRFEIWTNRNMLKLNSRKTQPMIIGTRNKLSKIQNPSPFIIQNKKSNM